MPMVPDDAMFTLMLLFPGFVLGSLTTAVVFVCACRKPERFDATKESKDGHEKIVKAKTGVEPSQRKRCSGDFTLDSIDDVVYVPATGSCVHKNPRCGGMKNPQKFKLCSVCMG